MKVRKDFVSNSSSCSFVVESTPEAKVASIGMDIFLLKMMTRIKEATFCAKRFSDSLLEECKASSVVKVKAKSKIKIVHGLSTKQLDEGHEILEKVSAEAETVCCDFGLDDCGEMTQEMGQVGAMFELAGYKINDEDSSTGYDSIKWMLED